MVKVVLVLLVEESYLSLPHRVVARPSCLHSDIHLSSQFTNGSNISSSKINQAIEWILFPLVKTSDEYLTYIKPMYHKLEIKQVYINLIGVSSILIFNMDLVPEIKLIIWFIGNRIFVQLITKHHWIACTPVQLLPIEVYTSH